MADTIARSHLAHSSIRAQATRRKPTKQPNKPGPGDRQSVKAVLASPWTVQWEGEGEGEDLVGELCGVVGEVRVFHGEREKRRRGESRKRGKRSEQVRRGVRSACCEDNSCSLKSKRGST